LRVWDEELGESFHRGHLRLSEPTATDRDLEASFGQMEEQLPIVRLVAYLLP